MIYILFCLPEKQASMSWMSQRMNKPKWVRTNSGWMLCRMHQDSQFAEFSRLKLLKRWITSPRGEANNERQQLKISKDARIKTQFKIKQHIMTLLRLWPCSLTWIALWDFTSILVLETLNSVRAFASHNAKKKKSLRLGSDSRQSCLISCNAFIVRIKFSTPKETTEV